MAKPRKGVVPAALKPFQFKPKGSAPTAKTPMKSPAKATSKPPKR